MNPRLLAACWLVVLPLGCQAIAGIRDVTVGQGEPDGGTGAAAVAAGQGEWLAAQGRYRRSGRYRRRCGVGAHTPRHFHTAVWTGTQMIVWGGEQGSAALGDGGVFTP